MALLTYEIRGLGDMAADRREDIRRAMATGDPRNSAIIEGVMTSYQRQSSGIPPLLTAPPSAGGLGIPVWAWWVAGGLGVAFLAVIGVRVIRGRKKAS